MSTGIYHEGARALQDRFDTRRLADRLEAVKVHARFTTDDVAFIESLDMLLASPFVPQAGCPTPVPAWKQSDWAHDVLPEGDPARGTLPPTDAPATGS